MYSIWAPATGAWKQLGVVTRRADGVGVASLKRLALHPAFYRFGIFGRQLGAKAGDFEGF